MVILGFSFIGQGRVTYFFSDRVFIPEYHIVGWYKLRCVRPGLGLVSAPLYLFAKFFEGKATEHLIGEGIQPQHLNDHRLGRVLDKLYLTGLSQIFTVIALGAAKKFNIATETAHLDST